MADIYNIATQAYQQGRQRAQDKRLNELAQLAMRNPSALPELGAQMAGIDASAGLQLSGAIRDRQLADSERNRSRALGLARFLRQIPQESREQVAAAYRKRAPDLPQALDDNSLDAYVSMAQAGGMGDARVQSRFVGEDGQVYAMMSNSPIPVPTGIKADQSYQVFEGVDENGRPIAGAFNKRFGTLGGFAGQQGVAPEQASSAPAQSAPQGITVPSLIGANFPTARITSGIRDPQTNARVGGVPNSLHMTGDAADIVPESPQQAAMIRQFAQQNGLQVIQYPDGRLHLERDTGAPRRNFSPMSVPGTISSPDGLLRGPDPVVQAQRTAAATAAGRILTENQLSEQSAETARTTTAATETGRIEGQREAQPLPPEALAQVMEREDAVSTASGLQNRLRRWETAINEGQLQLSPALNLRWEAELASGRPSRQAINYREFLDELESIRNDVLRLNKGVQTEGDAQRAMNEIIANPRAGAYVMQRLKTLIRQNQRAEELQRKQIERIRQNYQTPAQRQAQPQRYENDAGQVIEWNGSEWVEVN